MTETDTTTRTRPDPAEPPSSAALTRRTMAATVDAALVLAPLLCGWYFLAAINDGSGSNQADQVVFGGLALAASAGLLVWNRGVREGRTGTTVGKSWLGLRTRDTETGGPIGTRAALRRQVIDVLTLGATRAALASDRRTRADLRLNTEVVPELVAREEGFVPLPPVTTPAVTQRKRLYGLAGLIVLGGLVVLASLAVGAQPMSLGQVYHALLDATGSQTDEVVRTLRIPRTALGFVVGIALGIAGALIQGHTRNPLADAGLLGLNAGAAFLVVLAIHFLNIASSNQYIWFAFAGTLIASVIVFGAASVGGGRATPLSLALAGAAVTFFLQAMTNAVVLMDTTALDSYRFWVVGSLAGRGSEVFWQVLPFLAIGVVLALASSPGLNTLSLGDDVARSLGSNIATTRVVGIVAVTLLAGAATAACGPIAFIGLIVPHIARAITGPDYRWLVPYSGLLGGILLLFADVIGRVVVRPGELQVGIVLAVIGAPFFIAVVRRRNLVRL
ncbi:iron chelate uptake ABC transporter family permease subunit [Aldersonia kunmingensis]|uniref:iron chelate uptake ABC transporter family permease subunit n=1 Tax=Aldersonia kunmingensis TaxID=408066 RepID=UPI000A0056A0|nr:iron chelate uptake ABC transporter family permease subunit [Aldersonia kunmingensis]